MKRTSLPLRGRIQRREFIALIGGAAAAWPLAARAQQARKVVRIGYLTPTTAGGNPITGAAFEGTLQQLGWVKGHNITIEYRHSGGRQDTVAPLVAALLLERVGFRRRLDRQRDAMAIVFLAALASMLISATIGT